MNERLQQAIEVMRPYDAKARILGSFVIERTPTILTFAPAHIEKACIGLELPVRFADFLQFDFVSLEHNDLIASLLLQGKEEQADWFDSYAEAFSSRGGNTNWGFSSNAGKIALDSPVSTDAYYKYLARRYR